MKKPIEITHLVTNGCSFTYCQGLEDPKTQGWPALVAKKLGVPVINLAARGSGNDAIFRRNYEYFYLNKNLDNKPFWITAWSFAARREEYFDTYRDLPLNDFQTLSLKDGNTLEKEIVMNIMTPKGLLACERKKMLHWAACLELFKNNNIPYLITEYMPTLDEAIIDYLRINFPTQYNTVYEDDNKITNLSQFSKLYSQHQLPCGHDGLPAMEPIANYVYEQITKRYDVTVKAPEKGFVDLEGYRTDTEGMHESNVWRNK